MSEGGLRGLGGNTGPANLEVFNAFEIREPLLEAVTPMCGLLAGLDEVTMLGVEDAGGEGPRVVSCRDHDVDRAPYPGVQVVGGVEDAGCG